MLDLYQIWLRFFEPQHHLLIPLRLLGGRTPLLGDFLCWLENRRKRKYRYQKIPKGYTRILTVFTNLSGRGFRCCMTPVEIDKLKGKRFAALSYTWGNPQPYGEPTGCYRTNSNILLSPKPLSDVAKHTKFWTEDGDLPAEPQVIEALVGIITMGWEGEGPNKPRRLKIWIDSLCINQNDLNEKEDQVSRMGEIYAAAGTTVVWLGLHDEYTLDALRCVTKLWAIQFDEWNAYRRGVIDVDERGAMDKIGIVTAQELYALGRFLLRNWFRRVWILQEVVLARKIEVRCGPMKFDWDKLCHACGFMTHTNIDLWIWRHLETSIPAPGLFEEISQRRFLLPTLVDKMRRDPANRGPLSMHYLSRQQLATDPRDHVYGILGIISSQKEPESGDSSLVEPNYRVTTALAFENAAWALMAAEANALSLLGHVEDKSLTKADLLPSWAPDFSVPCAHVPLERLRTKHIFHASESINQEYDSDEEVGVTGYMSTGHGRPLLGLNLTWQDSSLVVCGTHVDLIVDTGPSYRNIVAEGKLGDLFEFVYNSEITAYFTGEHIYHVLWKCLCANTVDGEPAKAELCYDFVTWAGLYIVKLRKERGQPRFAEQLSQLPPSFTLEELYDVCPRGEYMAMQAGSVLSVPNGPADSIVPSSDDYGRFGNELLRHGYGGRRIFRTKHGYLGTGLESTRPGDCVYIVEGCNVPLVMRSAEGCFHLLGEAYVHGIMHGEFVHAHQPNFAEMRLV